MLFEKIYIRGSVILEGQINSGQDCEGGGGGGVGGGQ